VSANLISGYTAYSSPQAIAADKLSVDDDMISVSVTVTVTVTVSWTWTWYGQ
jgi:hypothetical protein